MDFSELETEWHPTLNLPLLFNLSLLTGKKYWWLGKCGHEWETVLAVRKQGSGCPICSNRLVLSGFNDLATNNPELTVEWHPTKNGSLTPHQIISGSPKKVWWLGRCGHEWIAAIINRNNGYGCPVCSGKKVLVGFNDLATTNPSLAAEWHPLKNDGLTPQKITSGANKRVWWLGKCNHEWETSVSNRASGTKCPVCAGKIVIMGFNDLASQNPAIAKQWHPTKNGKLTPDQIHMGSRKSIWWVGKCGHEWEAPISTRIVRLKTLGGCPICGGQRLLVGFNDLATVHPRLLPEWHPTKNGKLTPDRIVSGYSKKIWWLGKCGHEWDATPNSRRKDTSGCPICSGHRVSIGFNDLATLYPEIAAEWHPARNGDLTPQQVTVGRDKKVWWRGKCNHEWNTSIEARIGQGTNCPYCSGHKVLVGFNDLLTNYPVIAAEWHPTLNGENNPEDFSVGSEKKVWWLGKCNHEWEARIKSRTLKSTGCGLCAHVISKAELEIKEFLETFELVIESSNRVILNGKEIDLWIPALKVGIEFNGIYWHSEKTGRKSKDYHHNKYLAAQKAGIQLIQIWEDDWNQKPEVVKRVLTQKLGVAKKLLAEKTDVITITKQQAEEFLSENHLQGFTAGSYHLGLVSKGDIETLRAVMVLNKEPGNTLSIVRYATNANVRGGFTKLVSYAKNSFKPEAFIATADHCRSDSGLYEDNGFIAEEVLPPDYMYVVKNERKPRSEYPLERFHSDPKLLWEEGLTEMELADLNSLDRIWDAGKTSYRLVL